MFIKSWFTQFYGRIALGYLVLAVIFATIGVTRSNHLKQQFTDYELNTQTTHTQARLAHSISNWQRDAHRTTTTLSFLLQQSSKDSHITKIINDYFSIQNGYRDFDIITISSHKHSLIMLYGCDEPPTNWQTLNQTGLLTFSCEGHQESELYFMVENKLVTSDNAELSIHYGKKLDAQTLSALSPRSSLSYVEYRTINYPNHIYDELNHANQENNNIIGFSLPWPNETNAFLHVGKFFPPQEPSWFVFIPPLIALLSSFLVVWLAFGAWARKNSADLSILKKSALHYTESRDLPSTEQLLSPLILSERTNDASQLAQTLWQLIQRISASLEEEKKFTETLTLLEEAIVTLDSSGNILESSTGWFRLTRAVSPTGERFIGYVHPDDRAGWLAKTAQLKEGAKDLIHIRFRLNTEGISHPWVEGKFLCHTGDEGNLVLRGALRDVTQSYLHEKQITHMALHDALTGIANRILLEDRLKQAIQMADRHHRQLGILFFDLDHFKQINDSLGHKVGDQLLIAVSSRIQEIIRAGDTLARWGGDEFVILFSDMETEKITSITEKLLDTMQTPFTLEDHELSISYSMGVAIYPHDAHDIQGLFANADRAMFHAKSQGRNQVCFYADMNYKENGKQELYIQNRLIDAIKKKQINVHYQPIIDQKSNQVISVEALARWNDERYGQVSPATFIPIVENHGLSCQFGEQVIQQSLETLVSWRAQGLNLSMSINISARQLFSPSFIPNLLLHVSQYQISTLDIVLEVTESLALRDVDHAIDNLIELQSYGFKVSIDDFGTGHSSLAQLQEISADKLKIDRRFIQQLDTSKGYAMVLAIQHMAQALGLKTVAEGVETPEQQQMVSEMGIDFIQGYYYAKAMDKETCLAWIKQHNTQA